MADISTSAKVTIIDAGGTISSRPSQNAQTGVAPLVGGGDGAALLALISR